MKIASVVFALALIASRVDAVETPIGAIVDDGEGYNGQAVVVSGTVVDPAYAYAGQGLYTLTQDERRITVVAKQPPPPIGAQVTLDATVGWKEGDEEFTWPPILLESGRTVTPESLIARVERLLARVGSALTARAPTDRVDSDLGAAANGGGCYPTGLQTSVLDMLTLIDPEWAPVTEGHTVDSTPITVHGTVDEMHGDTSGDFPSTHLRADVVHVLDLDDDDKFRLGTGNDDDRLQTEWEAGQYPAWAWAGEGDRMVAMGRYIFDCGHPGPVPGNCSATTARACVVADDCRPPVCPGCGSHELCQNVHFNYSTELHPPQAAAAIRVGRGGIVSDALGTAAVPATRVDVYASPYAGGAGDRCVLTHLSDATGELAVQCFPLSQPVAQFAAGDFRFDVPLPPRPPGGRLSWRITDRSLPGARPARLRIQRHRRDGVTFLTGRLKLGHKTHGLLPTGYAGTIEAGWLGDTTPLTHVRTTITRLDVNNALQPVTPSVPRTCSSSDTPCSTTGDCPSGESCFGRGPVKSWAGQIGVNGEWTEFAGLDVVDDGGTYPQSIVVDQYLPPTASLHLQATVRSHECIDSMYGTSLAVGLVDLGFNKGVLCLATNARDPGAVDVDYPGPDFGSGGSSTDYQTVSVGGDGGHCSSTTGQLCTVDADCPSGETCTVTGAAYALAYRIEKLP
jgi:hypothetical protein